MTLAQINAALAEARTIERVGWDAHGRYWYWTGGDAVLLAESIIHGDPKLLGPGALLRDLDDRFDAVGRRRRRAGEASEPEVEDPFGGVLRLGRRGD